MAEMGWDAPLPEFIIAELSQYSSRWAACLWFIKFVFPMYNLNRCCNSFFSFLYHRLTYICLFIITQHHTMTFGRLVLCQCQLEQCFLMELSSHNWTSRDLISSEICYQRHPGMKPPQLRRVHKYMNYYEAGNISAPILHEVALGSSLNCTLPPWHYRHSIYPFMKYSNALYIKQF